MSAGQPKHASLGPSSAERWFNCPGSVAAIAAAPRQESSIHAAEGTVAHELCEEFVTGKISADELALRVGSRVKKDGFDIEITDEMVGAAIVYKTTIEADFGEIGIDAVRRAEVRVYATSVSPQLYGTADYVMFVNFGKLIVYDFKYGKGVVVSVEENKQMAIYALAAIDTFKLRIAEIELVVIQPRAGGAPVRRWSPSLDWAQKFKLDLMDAVVRTKDPNAPRAAGSWCRWCAAKGDCPAALEDVQKQAMIDFADTPIPVQEGKLPDISGLPVEILTRALEHEEYVSSWFEAVRLRLKQRLDAGLPVPGYKLVEGRANRRFTDDLKVIEEFGDALGDRILEPAKLISPAKLEKLVGKGKIDHLTYKPEAGRSIVRESDPRPAVASSPEIDFAPKDELDRLLDAINKDA